MWDMRRATRVEARGRVSKSDRVRGERPVRATTDGAFDIAGKLVVVAGGGGFIGGHLCAALAERGAHVRAVDVKPVPAWYQHVPRTQRLQADLRRREECARVLDGAGVVYNLAADMGGMGFIERNKAACMLSVLINTHLLLAAREVGVERYFYASSACVYAAGKQNRPGVVGLRETDAYPAMPEDGYGWEKLFGERMCRHFFEDFGLECRVARYHNIYGPFGAYEGGREKAPAAICRKVIEAKLGGSDTIEIWGDGNQTRSFTYVDDCIDGTLRLAHSGFRDPLNIGSDETVSINQLVELVEEIAGVRLERRYVPDAPVGVRGRSSDNTLVRQVLGWAPSTRLADGMERTYRWVYDRMTGAPAGGAGPVRDHARV
jgi:nucleoside-diphosphate-sugar epimerase